MGSREGPGQGTHMKAVRPAREKVMLATSSMRAARCEVVVRSQASDAMRGNKSRVQAKRGQFESAAASTGQGRYPVFRNRAARGSSRPIGRIPIACGTSGSSRFGVSHLRS